MGNAECGVGGAEWGIGPHGLSLAGRRFALSRRRARGDAPHLTLDPSLRLWHRPGKDFIRVRRAEGRPAERGGAEVAQAARGVAPAAVGVLILREPVQAGVDGGGGIGAGGWKLRAVPPRERECRDRRGGGERAAGKFAGPMARRRARGGQRGGGLGQRSAETAGGGRNSGRHAGLCTENSAGDNLRVRRRGGFCQTRRR